MAQREQNQLILCEVKTKQFTTSIACCRIPPHRLKMDFFFGSSQCSGSKSSTGIILFLFYTMLSRWASVECWSYHYSDTRMNWTNARDWCMKHYTHMVAIQNQEEISHLNNLLPKKDGYYWIGIRKIDDVWTWVGTNKPLTPEATNWAKGEPNNGKVKSKNKVEGLNEDCVEMYIKRNVEPGKWNDMSCKMLKTALCYTAACKNDSCVHGECVETINSHKCECFEGFYGDRCEKVVQCKENEVTVPEKASVSCTHPFGNYSYGSECRYSCEEGYQLTSPETMRCTGSGTWSEQPPTCKLVQCEELSIPEKGSMECSGPLGSSSYLSTCQFSCDEGYELVSSQSGSLCCGASGFWNDSQPFCDAVKCPVLQDPENGAVRCGGDLETAFRFETSCTFSCARGYRLQGPSTVTCTSAAEWSDNLPHCQAITCLRPAGDNQLITECSDTSDQLLTNSTCSFRCNAGFELQGASVTQCSEDGEWTTAVPTCKVVQCEELSIPEKGSMECSGPLGSSSYLSTCQFSCDEGYELVGSQSGSLRCGASGFWNDSQPFCDAVKCPVLQDPENGAVRCGGDQETAFRFETSCTFSCARGYRLLGPSSVTCTSAAEWSDNMPSCQAITCLRPAGDNQLITECSDTSDKLLTNSTCSFSCNAGFELQGASVTQCSEDGEWTTAVPTCKALMCPSPVVPTGGQVSCQAPPTSSPGSAGASQPQGSVCVFTCDEGHELNGSHSMECTQSGQWSAAPPTCTAVRCTLLEAPVNGEVNCSNSELMYSTQCFFTCDQDHLLHGHGLVTCDRHGNWTGETPICQANPVQSQIAALTAGGTVSLSGLSLAFWLLKRLRKKANKFELNSSSDLEDTLAVYKSTSNLV